jgi:RimJ/RimL family protein N-acetyltransferase
LDTPLDSPIIRTERLVIRPHRVSDAETWYGLQSDEGVTRFLSWPLRSRSESLQHLKDRTQHTVLSQADDLLALAIEHNGTLVGDLSVHLRTVHPDFRSAEIGWILGSAHGGAGLATEAVCAVIDLLFDSVEAKWVFAVVDERNAKSLSLATRLGFTVVNRDGPLLTMMVTPESSAACDYRTNRRR